MYVYLSLCVCFSDQIRQVSLRLISGTCLCRYCWSFPKPSGLQTLTTLVQLWTAVLSCEAAASCFGTATASAVFPSSHLSSLVSLLHQEHPPLCCEFLCADVAIASSHSPSPTDDLLRVLLLCVTVCCTLVLTPMLSHLALAACSEGTPKLVRCPGRKHQLCKSLRVRSGYLCTEMLVSIHRLW